jgi:hypothetical protein
LRRHATSTLNAIASEEILQERDSVGTEGVSKRP